LLIAWSQSMPIFEYRCQDCGHRFEAILFGAQKPECPQCHAQRLEQQLSVFAVSKGNHATLPDAGCGASNCCMMNGGCGCEEN
jgi:putative FmdB family regulatory protein